MVSRKKFNEEAKRMKRKLFVTAAEARDRLAANRYGYATFAELEQAMTDQGKWKP